MTKLLVLTSTFPATKGDSTPQFVLDLIERTPDLERCVVVTPRVPGGAREEFIGDVEVRRFAYFPKRFEGVAHGATLPNVRAQPWRAVELPFLMLAFWFAARRALKELDPDLVHAHWVLPSGMIATAAMPGDVPVVMTAHGVDLHALRIGPLEWLRRRCLRRADHVIAVSADLLDRVGDLAPDTPATVIPMGADLDAMAQSVGFRSPIDGRVVFVGRLAEKKGVDRALRALVDVPAATFVVAGDGPERARLEALSTELGLDDRVEFLGHADRATVATTLRTAEVIVIPSVIASDGDMEGTPVVLAEACAARVPIVASDLGGMGELLDDSMAWLVEPGDVDGLAAALVSALSDDTARSAKTDRAHAMALDSLDATAVAAAHADLYAKVTS